MDTTSSPASSAADDVRSAEQKRLNALITDEMEVSGQLHADDFQLVTHLGAVFQGRVPRSRRRRHPSLPCLGTRLTDQCRMYHDVGLIRYRAQVEIEMQGQLYPRAPVWFTDAYEKRDGQWQIVWSQGTMIA
jgi:hypothetical protein